VSTDSLLAAFGLSKSYGSQKAISDVSLEIGGGEILAILGPNGAGKTTLLSIIAGALQPDSGRIHIGGPHTKASRLIGFVPQGLGLYPILSAQQNLRFISQVYRIRDWRTKIDHALEMVGLADRRHDVLWKLSGGMQRRLSIAMALLHGPRLLILDEPTSGIDPQSRSRIFEVVKKLASTGAGVIYSTHQLGDAEQLCDRVLILDRGSVLEEGPLDRIVAEHSTQMIEIIFKTEVGSFCEVIESLGRLPGVHSVETSAYRACLRGDASGECLAEVENRLRAKSVPYRSIRVVPRCLETAFLNLTSRATRK